MKLWNKLVMVGLLLIMGLVVSGMATFARTDNHSLGDVDREGHVDCLRTILCGR